MKEIDKLLRNLLATLSLISLCSSGNLSTSWLLYIFSWKCDCCPFLDPAPFCSCCSIFCLKAKVFSNCDLRFISTLVLKSFCPKYSHIVQWSTASISFMFVTKMLNILKQKVMFGRIGSGLAWEKVPGSAKTLQQSYFCSKLPFFWQPLYLLTKQKNIFTIFVNAEYPDFRSEAANIIFQAPLKANEDDRSGVSHKWIFCHIMVLGINYTSVTSFLSNTNNLNC